MRLVRPTALSKVFFFFLLFAFTGSVAQNVVKVEYFVDVDPGFGKATNVPVTAAADLTSTFQVNLGGVANGFHHLFVRSYVPPYKTSADTLWKGGWSLTAQRSFYKESFVTGNTVPSNITQGEYYIDADPGFGKASPISFSPAAQLSNLAFSFDVSGVAKGFHHVFVRFRNADGSWGLTNQRSFYKEAVPVNNTAAAKIVRGEYFIDADPGFGHGTNIPLTPGADLSNVTFLADVSSLPAGFHHLYARFRDENGYWGITNVRSFYKESLPAAGTLSPIVKGEYFIDVDPGFGKARNIPLTEGNDLQNLSYTADLAGLALGFHRLQARLRVPDQAPALARCRVPAVGQGGGVPCGSDNLGQQICSVYFNVAGCIVTGIGCWGTFTVIGSVPGAIVGAALCGIGIGSCINGFMGNTSIDVGGVDLLGCLGGPDAVLCVGQYICNQVVKSCDPNDIIGPKGYGPAKFVSANTIMPYTIRFENDSTFATAPAQRVEVREKLDPNVNPLSFRVRDFGFGKFTFTVPENTSAYFNTVDLPDSLGYDLQVTAGIDVIQNEAFWVLQTIDPATGLPPVDPLKGFLLINDSVGSGEGFVSYTVRPKATVNTGDTIHARAEIVFDINAPIVTPQIFNTIDAVSPWSVLNPLPAISDTTITLSWKGFDDAGGSGVREYAVYVSENGGPFNLYKKNIVDTTIAYVGKEGGRYCFFTTASDNVSNLEPLKYSCEGATVVGRAGLPVTWLGFRGERVADAVVLTWATANEFNTKHFVVERSVDGVRFVRIGLVKAMGNSSQNAYYSFTDNDALPQAVPSLYYRLQQVDRDEKFSYSTVVRINIDRVANDAVFRAFPNPFARNLTLTISTPGPVSASDKVELLSADGRLLYQRSLAGRRNGAPVLLNDLPELASGMYILKAHLSGEIISTKIFRKKGE